MNNVFLFCLFYYNVHLYHRQIPFTDCHAALNTSISPISSINDFRFIRYAPDEHGCCVRQLHISNQRERYFARVIAHFAVNIQLRIQQFQIPRQIVGEYNASSTYSNHEAAISDIGQQRFPESRVVNPFQKVLRQQREQFCRQWKAIWDGIYCL